MVLAFLEGLSPETIVAECFPVLTLEQAYGAIAYYLAHRREVDAELQGADAEFEALRQAGRSAEPEFYRKLAEARRQVRSGCRTAGQAALSTKLTRTASNGNTMRPSLVLRRMPASSKAWTSP